MEQKNSQAIAQQITEQSQKFTALRSEIAKVIVGHTDVVTATVISLLSNGHILLEGVPGVAKTTLIKTIAQALGLSFSRIQFTPDLLPADLIGTLIYNPKTQDFDTKKGPLFANLVLADEINRSPAKVQSALLEAMQEHQVTIGSATYRLDEPFLVYATQNPIENEGTYRLPEAQVDRFMFKLLVDYPTLDEEREIVQRSMQKIDVQQVVSIKDIMQARKLIEEIYIDPRVMEYILHIVFATRDPQKYKCDALASFIQYGVSPRATLALSQAAKSYAFVQGRHFVTPDDIKFLAPWILRHRLLLTYQAEAEDMTTDMVVKKILDTIVVP